MTIKQAIEQIDNGTQEVPSNWHAGTGLSDGVTWFEVREWLASLIDAPDCSAEVHPNNAWGRSCTLNKGHDGPHENAPNFGGVA